MERYPEIQRLAEGSYGEVCMCFDVQTNSRVAVKWIPFNYLRKGLPCSVLREISVLKELNHNNVVRLLDVVEQEDGINLVFECMELDLSKFIRNQSKTPVDPSHWIKDFLFQILEGVSYCHSQKVIHRDLKPCNLLINTKSNTVKLADFGYARTSDVPLPQYTTKVTTVAYKAPELLLATPYSSAADIWSVGCIFAEMVNKKPLVSGLFCTDVMREIISIFGLPDEREWRGVESAMLVFFQMSTIPYIQTTNLASAVPGLEQQGLDLLSKMMCIYPQKRITAYNALNHPYFSGLRRNN